MLSNTCPNQRKLIDFCIGKATDEEIDQIARHLETCKACATRVDALESLPIPFVNLVRDSGGRLHVDEEMNTQTRRILERVKELCAVRDRRAEDHKLHRDS